MDWTKAIEDWKAEHIAKYGKGETETREHDSYYGYRTVAEPYIVLPEQDITVSYNGKELIHCNGDYKPGMIKKAIQKTFTGTKRNREYQEIENA
jgi:hypothetical protein